MRKTIIMPIVIASALLVSCNQPAMYEMAYRAVDKLQTMIVNPTTIYIKNTFHGTPPIEGFEPLILLLYSSLDAEDVRVNGHFAYISEERYYTGLDAVELYEFREYYFQLDSQAINDHYGFDL